MKILATSDTHGLNLKSEIYNRLILDAINKNKPDVVTFSGDIFPNNNCNPKSDKGQYNYFKYTIIPFVEKYNFKLVFTLGNHDYLSPILIEQLIHEYKLCDRIFLLLDKSVVIDGVKFYGTPWSLPFCNWNYQAHEQYIDEILGEMPSDVDVMLCHQPPFGYNDVVVGEGEHIGSVQMYKKIVEKQPKYVLCGHIHTGSHEISNVGKTKIRNVSLLDESYNETFLPFLFDI